MGLNELITNEDPYHIHKSLGFYVLLHYFYQFYYFFNFNKMDLSPLNLLPHIALHLSSFVFKVLSRRSLSAERTSMFIWEELRLHSMIFSYRSCFSILFPEYAQYIVFITMLFADFATILYGVDGISTVRGNHSKETSKLYKKISAAFFSSSQMGATIICGGFFQNNYSDVLTFSTLPAIQTSAFGMTLIRKNIINKTIWQAIYVMELLLVYYMWYMVNNNLIIIPLNIGCYMLRKRGVNKYCLFLTITLIDYLWRNTFFVDNLFENIDFNYEI